MLHFDECVSDCHTEIFTYAAGEYLAGSIFFLIGGILNTIRVYIVDQVLHLHRPKVGKIPKIEVVSLDDMKDLVKERILCLRVFKYWI